MIKSPIKKIGGVIISVTFLLVALASLEGAPQSEEEAYEQIVGTYTYITPGKEFWQKYIFKNDRTFELYYAQPMDGKWPSKPSQIGKYYIDKARYTDTGAEYFRLVCGFISAETPDPFEGMGGLTLIFSMNDDGSISDKEGYSFKKGQENPW